MTPHQFELTLMWLKFCEIETAGALARAEERHKYLRDACSGLAIKEQRRRISELQRLQAAVEEEMEPETIRKRESAAKGGSTTAKIKRG